MIAGIVLVIALFFLGMQVMDPSFNITLASEFNIPTDKVFSNWAILNWPLHAVIYDAPIGSPLLLAGGVIYWVSDWLNEKLGTLGKSAPLPPIVSEPKS